LGHSFFGYFTRRDIKSSILAAAVEIMIISNLFIRLNVSNQRCEQIAS